MPSTLAEALGLPPRPSETDPPVYDPMNEQGGFFSDLGSAISGAASSAAQTLGDVVERITSDELDIGLNPQQKERRSRLEDMGVARSQQLALVNLHDSNVALYTSTVAALLEIDPNNSIPATPAAKKDALEGCETSRRALESLTQAPDARSRAKAAEDACAAARAALERQQQERAEAEARLKRARTAAAAAAGTPDAEARSELVRGLEAALELIRDAGDEARLATDLAQAETAYERDAKPLKDADAALAAARVKLNKLEQKEAVVAAVTYGPLSDLTALDDAHRTAFLDLCAQDVGLGLAAINAISKAEDPAAFATDAKTILDRFAGGFGKDAENKPDLPENAQRRMAEECLRKAADKGPDWTRGLVSYLDSGRQNLPDPANGTAPPLEDRKAESARKLRVGRARAAMAAKAVLKDDGSVDFGAGADEAPGTHMLQDLEYHPGSLLTPTPVLTDQVNHVQKLFTGAKAAEATARLKSVGPPTNETARELVTGTTGGAATDDKAAREAVLTTLMTPMTQGPVGSCFATGPVRRQTEVDPVRTLDQLAQIATNGTLKLRDDRPADPVVKASKLPPGENPLLRSHEYSIANASVAQTFSRNKRDLRSGVMAGNGAFQKVAAKIEPSVWTGNATREGLEPKLREALATRLEFRYDATRESSGGDGVSSQGQFVLFHGTTEIDTAEKYAAALKTIAKDVATTLPPIPPIPPAPQGGGDVVVSPADAVDLIFDDVGIVAVLMQGYAGHDRPPWNQTGGGFNREVMEAMSDNLVTETEVGDEVPDLDMADPVAVTARSKALLQDVFDKVPDKTLSPVATNGEGANHAFAVMADTPAFQEIKADRAKLDSKIVTPGKAVADRVLSVAQAQALYTKCIRASFANFSDSDGAVASALSQMSQDGGTAADVTQRVHAELDRQLQGAKAAFVESQKEDFIKKHKAAHGGAEPDASAVEEYERAQAKVHEAHYRGKADAVLREEIPTPALPIADTNWGDFGSEVQFVMAVDPIDGALRLFKEDTTTGQRTPADSYLKAKWFAVDEVELTI